MMLYAFAMENYCKGALVGRSLKEGGLSPEARALLRQNGKLPQRLKKHDLLKLANSIGFNVGVGDEELLRRLTHAAIVDGPVPGRDRFRCELRRDVLGRKDLHLELCQSQRHRAGARPRGSTARTRGRTAQLSDVEPRRLARRLKLRGSDEGPSRQVADKELPGCNTCATD
jgi:hypothetical protein